MVDFDCKQFYRVLGLVSFWSLCSFQCPFCVRQKSFDNQPEYLQFLVFQLQLAVYQSIQIIQRTYFGILCRLVDWVFLFCSISVVLRGFMSGLRGDPKFCQDFRCRRAESVVLLLWFVCFEEFVQVGSQIGITFRNHTEDGHVHRFDELGLLRSEYGELGSLYILHD